MQGMRRESNSFSSQSPSESVLDFTKPQTKLKTVRSATSLFDGFQTAPHGGLSNHPLLDSGKRIPLRRWTGLRSPLDVSRLDFGHGPLLVQLQRKQGGQQEGQGQGEEEEEKAGRVISTLRFETSSK